jgi:hypothetical protein
MNKYDIYWYPRISFSSHDGPSRKDHLKFPLGQDQRSVSGRSGIRFNLLRKLNVVLAQVYEATPASSCDMWPLIQEGRREHSDL